MQFDDFLKEMKADFEAIGNTYMPYGRYGPKDYPPRGVPIYDLPAEYLSWYAHKGFPKSKLGRLLQIVYEMKVEGSDPIFDVFRQARGGRTKLRKS